jgi:NAD(P)-dependent dehydrogenase (short-subunit alcohol dehydrogenase family)
VAEDTASEARCHRVIKRTIAAFGRLDILVNNAAEQQPQPDLMRVAREQREQTLRTNLLGMFYLTKAANGRICRRRRDHQHDRGDGWRDSA